MLSMHIFKLTVGGKLLSFNVMFGMKNGSPHYDIRSTSIEGVNLLKNRAKSYPTIDFEYFYLNNITKTGKHLSIILYALMF